MDKLSRTEFILKEANALFQRVGVLWSGGKDSTALLHMISRAFDTFPFTAIHLDNDKEFPETYGYMDLMKKQLHVPLIRETIEIKHDAITGLMCCGHNKTEALKRVISKNRFDAIIAAIRWDEHGIRGLERYFSPRDKEFRWQVYNPDGGAFGTSLQDSEFVGWGIAVRDFGSQCDHVRVHPILHWTELDVWKYVQANGMPVNPLYFARNGTRYRSIGCRECSLPAASEAKTISEIVRELEDTKTPEREGRIQDKELAMERLRALGYM